MGMDVVAEGIETHEQYMLLRQLGCRFGQGFLFSRPVPAETMSAMLRLPGRILPDPAARSHSELTGRRSRRRRERADLGMARGCVRFGMTPRLALEHSHACGQELAVCSNPCSNPLQRSPPPLFPVLRDCWPRLLRLRPRSHLTPQPMRRCGTRATWAKTWPLSATSSALRAHARYRPADRDESDGSIANADGRLGLRRQARRRRSNAVAVRAPMPCWAQSAAAPDRDLRSASVTIRLSKAECARLHQRAAEAGLTVSAYLRSCALEAEALRAQVKQALAEMKAGSKGAREQRNKGTSRTLSSRKRSGTGSREMTFGQRLASC